MTEVVEFLTRVTLIGIGGAAAMDVWGVVARRAFGLQSLDYAFLGAVDRPLPTWPLLPRANCSS